MICIYCCSGRVVWTGPITNVSGTKCLDCGAVDCQVTSTDVDNDGMELEDSDAVI